MSVSNVRIHTDGSHWYKYGTLSSTSQPAISNDTPNGLTPLIKF